MKDIVLHMSDKVSLFSDPKIYKAVTLIAHSKKQHCVDQNISQLSGICVPSGPWITSEVTAILTSELLNDSSLLLRWLSLKLTSLSLVRLRRESYFI